MKLLTGFLLCFFTQISFAIELTPVTPVAKEIRLPDLPLKSETSAKEAFRYYAAKESSFGPCGEHVYMITELASSWLIVRVIESTFSKNVSWKIMELRKEDASIIKSEKNDYKFNVSDC